MDAETGVPGRVGWRLAIDAEGAEQMKSHRSHRAGRRGGRPSCAVALAGLLAALLLALPAGAQALSFANGYLSQLTCESAHQCTALAANGVAATFNPTAGGRVIRAQTIPASTLSGQLGIACVSSTRCAVADAAGHVAVFDPTRSGAPAATFAVAGAQGQTSLACPSRHRCVADAYQGVSVFDPFHGGAPATQPFSANASGAQPTLSCPSTTLCVGSNGTAGLLSTFDPLDAAGAVVHTITSSPQVGGLACPSVSFCAALAAPPRDPSVNTGLVTFNPRHIGNPRVTVLTQSTLEFIACRSASLCAAAGNNQGVWVFNPRRPRHRHFTAVPVGVDLVGIAFAGRSELVLLGDTGQKAVIDALRPPGAVTLTGLARATPVR
jgi:hypothetical protein